MMNEFDLQLTAEDVQILSSAGGDMAMRFRMHSFSRKESRDFLTSFLGRARTRYGYAKAACFDVVHCLEQCEPNHALNRYAVY